MNPKQCREKADKLFDDRQSLESLWQEIAEHFYVERADFTYHRTLGEDFAEQLSTSYPLIARRELAAQIGYILRRSDQEWFYMTANQEDREAKMWLEWANGVQRRAMYDRASMFHRAATEGDNDWATFGQYVQSCRLNKEGNGLLYRTWHLRDCVWEDDEEGKIVFLARKWKPQVRDLMRYFGEKNSAKVKEMDTKGKIFERVNCYHIVMASDIFDGDSKRMPWFSLYIDRDHSDHVIEQTPQRSREYIVPRWQTVSGSQYAYSPATVAALPDARLIQAMTYTILEAGEKTSNPPLIATRNAVRSDMAIYSGGVTWVADDYDERLGDAIRPLNQDYRGLPFGMEMLQDTRGMIHQAFYLNKLNLPERAAEMTAFEVGQRIQEYIRGALPLFEPMEYESNGQLCELTFDVLMSNGAFGSPLDMPRSLSGAEVEFKYRSPLHDSIEAHRAQVFRQGAILISEAAALDQTVAHIPDAKEALRDVLEGIGFRQKWLRGEKDVEGLIAAQQQKQAMAETLAALEQGGSAAKSFAEAGAQVPA